VYVPKRVTRGRALPRAAPGTSIVRVFMLTRLTRQNTYPIGSYSYLSNETSMLCSYTNHS